MIFEREKKNRLSDAMECGVYIISYIINSSSSNYLDDVNELKKLGSEAYRNNDTTCSMVSVEYD